MPCRGVHSYVGTHVYIHCSYVHAFVSCTLAIFNADLPSEPFSASLAKKINTETENGIEGKGM